MQVLWSSWVVQEALLEAEQVAPGSPGLAAAGSPQPYHPAWTG